ncbi:MAG TPA: hypothetical protein VNN25_24930, partial [Thermoanaerobaculia bacterium]|nr:hypothetical protein [Thermoanaerobaculia bacterium]
MGQASSEREKTSRTLRPFDGFTRKIMRKIVKTRQTTSHLELTNESSSSVQNPHLHFRQAILIVAAVILSLFGCTAQDSAHGAKPTRSTSGPTHGTAAGDSKPCLGWPKRMVFLFDQSKSTQKTRTEHPAVERLDDVIECSKRHGGSIYAGPIRD